MAATQATQTQEIEIMTNKEFKQKHFNAMSASDRKINESLWESDEDGIVVMHGLRKYSIWMKFENFEGAWLSPSRFNKMFYKSRHAAVADFNKCGGFALAARTCVLCTLTF